MKCPNCQATVAEENINNQKKTAHCPECERYFSIYQLENENFNFDQSVKGITIHKEGNSIRIVAKKGATSSAYSFLGSAILFTAFFSFFAQFVNIPDKLEYVWVAPFCILSLLIVWIVTVDANFGKIELNIDRFGGKVFSGVGAIGFTNRFEWSEVEAIKLRRSTSSGHENSTSTRLIIEGRKKIKVGSLTPLIRLHFLYQALLASKNQVERKEPLTELV